MPETRLVDYSDARPSPVTIKVDGYVGVIRYLAPEPNPKVLTKSEAAALHAEGLAILLVFESTGNRAQDGEKAGAADRTLAEQEARALGYPTACPIFFAVDEQIPVSAVAPYFAGISAVKGEHPWGPYGDTLICRGVKGSDYQFQTAAWSSGVLDPDAHLFQRAKREGPNIAGTDEDVVCRSIPAWGPHGVVTLAPPGDVPAPPHKPTTFPLTHDMRSALELVAAHSEGRVRNKHPFAPGHDRELALDAYRELGTALQIP